MSKIRLGYADFTHVEGVTDYMNIAIDRGHINPMSYLRLRYLLESLGAEVTQIHGDRAKKKHLLPLFIPVFAVG